MSPSPESTGVPTLMNLHTFSFLFNIHFMYLFLNIFLCFNIQNMQGGIQYNCKVSFLQVAPLPPISLWGETNVTLPYF